MTTYTVFVADNSHYMDEDETYTQGEYASWQEAVAQARRIVDESLAELYRLGMSAAILYSQYTTFGADPYIVPSPEGEGFSAWDYAKQRSEVLCGNGDHNQREK